MDEELIDYLFETSRREGFKKNREDFVKYLQSDDELFDYLYGKAQKEGYKKDKAHFAGLVGRTTTAAPVATTEPAKTEVATTTTTEPTKTEPTTTAATTTPAKTEPTETAPAKTEPAKELSNKQSETIKVRSIPQREVEMPVADETKMPPMMVREAAPVAEEEPKKEMPIGENLLPVTEKTEVKAVETPSDKMVIKSEKKAEEPIKPMTEKEKEEWECPPAQGGCSKNKQSITNYFLDKYKIGGEYKPEFSRARISDREGNLADFIDNSFDGRGVAKIENEDWYDHNSKGYYYIAEENPKSKRFSVYNVPVDGKETSLIYDNKTGVIMKETNEDVKSEDGKPMKTWLNVPFKYDEYQTLKAEIDKAKGGTTTPKVSTVPTLEPWQQPQGTMQVKEVTEQPKAEVKAEEPKGIPSYDDLGIEKGTNLISNTAYYLPKGIEFKKLPPNELIPFLSDRFGQMTSTNLKLNRNTSIRYPDPIGTVFKKENINGKEVYSSYNKNNDTWYMFIEGSKNNNWIEVKSYPIKTFLNNKFLIEDDLYNEKNIKDKSTIDIPTEDEQKLIAKTRRSVYQNIYIPYLLKNEDKLSDDNVEKLQKALEGIADPKSLDILAKEPSFEGTLEDYLQRKKKMSEITNTNEYKSEYITDKKHLEVINQIIARTNKPNYFFKPFIENKETQSADFSYNEIENKRQNKELDFYKSILGDVYYDKNNDQFYWTEYNKKTIDEESFLSNMNDREKKFDKNSKLPYLIIKKGTPDYDKIKSSLSKYNK